MVYPVIRHKTALYYFNALSLEHKFKAGLSIKIKSACVTMFPNE